jgi:hypothetical protein
MMYNWQLWDNFQGAAQDLNFELWAQDSSLFPGSCVYMQVPEDIRQRFYVMCWTPLNKLWGVMQDYPRDHLLGTWQHRLQDLRQNDTDFYLEFGPKSYQHGTGWHWFPALRMGLTPTRQQIREAVEIMLDRDRFDQYVLMAQLRETDDD